MDDGDKPEEAQTCRRCQQPVLRFAKDYETFERMHWSCFHFGPSTHFDSLALQGGLGPVPGRPPFQDLEVESSAAKSGFRSRPVG